MSQQPFRCPHCDKPIPNSALAKHWGKMGGGKVTPKKIEALKQNIKKRWEKYRKAKDSSSKPL